MGDYKLLIDYDVETSINDDSLAFTEASMTSQERYPDASQKQADVLALIDEAVVSTEPKIDPPAQELGKVKLSDFVDLLGQIRIPCTLFVGSIAVAFAVFAINFRNLYLLYPFWIGLANFGMAIPSLKASFHRAYEQIASSVDSSVESLASKIDELGEDALKYVSLIEQGLDEALEPVRPKIRKAQKMERTILKVDPDIEIPDLSEIEGELNNAANKLSDAFDTVKDGIDLRNFIPSVLKSQQSFYKFFFFPILAIHLVVQLGFVIWGTAGKLDGNGDDVQLGVTDAQFLRGASFPDVLISSDSFVPFEATSNSTVSDTYEERVAEHFYLIWVAIRASAISLTTILIVYILTLNEVVKRMLNRKMLSITGKVNKEMGETLGPSFHDVFDERMNRVKAKLLYMIEQLEKIEAPLTRCSFLGL